MKRFIIPVKVCIVPRLTVTITEEQAELLEEKTGDSGEYESKSEAVRFFIQEYEHLYETVEELKTERDRLHRQLIATNQRVEEHTELVEYVEEERSWREAGIATRAKWWLFGKGERREGE